MSSFCLSGNPSVDIAPSCERNPLVDKMQMPLSTTTGTADPFQRITIPGDVQKQEGQLRIALC
jgi:hypothetical protein